jgi:hypothetical protein
MYKVEDVVASRFLVFSALLLIFWQGAAASGDSTGAKAGSWEGLCIRGNNSHEQGRAPDARKNYYAALKILEKEHANDLRLAILLNNIAETYRIENNRMQARITELRAADIYKREIQAHRLGYEYSCQKPIDFNSGSLRPYCYLCHENWKVVPILYGNSTGYDGDQVPSEDDAAFTHKPGGAVWCDQRWYCRECHQSF